MNVVFGGCLPCHQLQGQQWTRGAMMRKELVEKFLQAPPFFFLLSQSAIRVFEGNSMKVDVSVFVFGLFVQGRVRFDVCLQKV